MRPELSFHHLAFFFFLVTDDSATTNHPVKLHMILSQLTDVERKEQKSKREVARQDGEMEGKI